jgi:hypothetical protein
LFSRFIEVVSELVVATDQPAARQAWSAAQAALNQKEQK